jgi:hypothetical protein
LWTTQKKEKKEIMQTTTCCKPSTSSTLMEQRNTKSTIKINMYGNNGAKKNCNIKNYGNVNLGWDSLLS